MTWLPGGHDDWFSVNLSEANFRLRFNRRASVLYQDFEEAADQAAQLLYKEWGHRPLYVALSGGLDSELTARILLKNKIPFTPVILKIGDYNYLESWYAEYWCYTNNITPAIINCSAEEFVKAYVQHSTKLVKIKDDCQTPAMILHDYVQNLGGYCINSCGDINFDHERKEFYCATLDFTTNIVDIGAHPTSFFMYTPELALSYINQFDITQTEQYNKLKFYKVAARPKIDYMSPLHETYQPLMQVRDKLFFLFDFEKHNAIHWYGTKEQIIQDLHP